MAVELAHYLLQQGLAASQITILTPYTGQLRYSRGLAAGQLRYSKGLAAGLLRYSRELLTGLAGGVECHTVDSYQGLENY